MHLNSLIYPCSAVIKIYPEVFFSLLTSTIDVSMKRFSSIDIYLSTNNLSLNWWLLLPSGASIPFAVEAASF